MATYILDITVTLRSGETHQAVLYVNNPTLLKDGQWTSYSPYLGISFQGTWREENIAERAARGLFDWAVKSLTGWNVSSGPGTKFFEEAGGEENLAFVLSNFQPSKPTTSTGSFSSGIIYRSVVPQSGIFCTWRVR